MLCKCTCTITSPTHNIYENNVSLVNAQRHSDSEFDKVTVTLSVPWDMFTALYNTITQLLLHC